MMDVTEVRMRAIEAAAKSPSIHKDGFAAGVLETANKWAYWILYRPQHEEPKGDIKDLL